MGSAWPMILRCRAHQARLPNLADGWTYAELVAGDHYYFDGSPERVTALWWTEWKRTKKLRLLLMSVKETV